MKKFLSLLVVVTLAGSASLAMGAAEQNKADKVAEKVKTRSSKERMMPEPVVQLKRLTKGLKLTPEQQKQIKPVLDDEYAKLKEIRRNDELAPKQIQQQVEALRTDTVAKVKTFLTPEQQERYDAVSAEIKANKQKRIKENRRSRIGTKADPAEQPKQ